MTSWFYSYGISTSPERFQQELGEVEAFRPATIAGHRLHFANYNADWGGGTSCIVPSSYDRVIGTAYRVSDDQMASLLDGGSGYRWQEKVAQIDGEDAPVRVLLPEVIGDFAEPADEYVAKIREGLSYFYPMHDIDPYLRRALQRPNVFRSFKARWADEAAEKREYGIGFRRLLPWQGVVRAPWGAAWGRLAPGETTELYVHDEEEAAIVVSGRGELRVDEETRTVQKGDLVYFPPDCEHVVHNNADDGDLEVLFIWWGGKEGALWAGRPV